MEGHTRLVAVIAGQFLAANFQAPEDHPLADQVKRAVKIARAIVSEATPRRSTPGSGTSTLGDDFLVTSH